MKTLNNNFVTFTKNKKRGSDNINLEFEGFKKIGESYAMNHLFLNDKTEQYEDENQEEVGLSLSDVEAGVGIISLDGDYDTTYTLSIDELGKNEISVILLDGSITDTDKVEVLEANGYFIIEDDFYSDFEINNVFYAKM